MKAEILYDKLFEHFFSRSRSEYNLENVRCFMKIIPSHLSNDGDNKCISQSILAYYLKRILKSNSDGHKRGLKFIFNRKVCKLWTLIRQLLC